MTHINLPLTPASALARALPAPCRIGTESVSSPSYHWRGAKRKSEANLQVYQHTLSGRGNIIIDGKIHSVPAGTGFLCELFDPRITYYYDAKDNGAWTFCYIVFRGVGNWVKELTEQHGHLFTMPNDCPALMTFRKMLRKPETPPLLDAGTALELTSALFAQLCRTSEKKSTNKTNQLLTQAIRIMHENVESPNNIADIAARLDISPEHLSRIFRQEIKTSPLTYLHRQKIRRACMLLADPQLPIKEIARRLGIPNVTNFTRFFKRHTGIPPSLFRSQGHTSTFTTEHW
jgi:AraC-like DNA-binding protein